MPLLDLSKAFLGGVGGVFYHLGFIKSSLPFLTLHPKVSHHCYKLANRERYKLTDRQQPRTYSLIIGGVGVEVGSGAENLPGRELFHSYTV